MTVVNTETGELVAVSPEERTAVARLTTAITALTEAVDFMPISDVVSIKGQVVTIQVATRELDMSQEAQDLAAEAVRRAEWTLGMAIRKGQAEGVVAKRGDIGGQGAPGVRGASGSPRGGHLDTPMALVGAGHPSELTPFYELADAAPRPEQFDKALGDAKAEGNLSRANVIRKVKGQSEGVGLTRQQRAHLIAELAEQGLTSRQMPNKVGVTEEVVRRIARDFDIDIPADRIVGKTRRLDHTQMVIDTVTGLVNNTEFIESFIDLDEVDFTEADEWVSSLTNSIRVLNRFVKQIKEKTHV